MTRGIPPRRTDIAERALLLGANGGVARAVQSLLRETTAGRRLLERLDELLLVDRTEPITAPVVGGAQILAPTEVRTASDLEALVRRHSITQVIDLSSIDTVDCTRMCDELGADYLSTSVEEWPERGSIPTNEAVARLLPPRRPVLKKRSHLIGSGANPGLVNALVFAALEAFAEKVGVEADPQSLELHSVLITEEDSTVEKDDTTPPGTFAMTWSPEHCLEELFEPRSFMARNGRMESLGHRPVERWYRARCGDRIIEGMAVPHEETKTLAHRLQNVDIAFVYRLPPPALRALATHPERREWPADWKTRRLYPPTTTELQGRDRVGVLLCSRQYGEFWLGFDTDVASALRYGTNATQLQVAAGVIAGWSQLGTRRGIHFVEDLDWRQFIEIAGELLGEPIAFYDPDAPVVSLSERALPVS